MFLFKCVHTWSLPPWVLLLSLALKNSYNLKNRTHPLINKNIKHFRNNIRGKALHLFLATNPKVDQSREEGNIRTLLEDKIFWSIFLFSTHLLVVAVVSEYDLCLRCNSTGVVSKRTRYLLKIHITNHYGNT